MKIWTAWLINVFSTNALEEVVTWIMGEVAVVVVVWFATLFVVRGWFHLYPMHNNHWEQDAMRIRTVFLGIITDFVLVLKMALGYLLVLL